MAKEGVQLCGTALIVSHAHKTPEYMIDYQYLNMLAKSIINNETGASLEYRRLIKCDRHKKTCVEYFANELGCIVQGVGDRVKDTSTLFLVTYEKTPTYKRKYVTCVQFFVITDPKTTNLTVQDLWQGTTTSFSQDITVQ